MTSLKQLRIYQKKLKKYPTKAELKLKNLLQYKRIPFIFQKRLKCYFYDFYIKPSNLLLEVDGEYHNRPKQKRRDQRKETLALEKGYNFLRIKNQQVFKNINRVLNKIINIKSEKSKYQDL